MGSYYNAKEGRLGLWNAQQNRINWVRTEFIDQIGPDQTPQYPKPEFFKIFANIIKQALAKFQKEVDSRVVILREEFDDFGHLRWEFGFADQPGLGMREAIDDIGAAAHFNQSDEALAAFVTRLFEQLTRQRRD